MKEGARPISTLQEENATLGENIFRAAIADQDQSTAQRKWYCANIGSLPLFAGMLFLLFVSFI